MIRAVLDSVVLVSAFITEHKRGVSAELLHAAGDGAFELHLSEDILRVHGDAAGVTATTAPG